MSAAPRLLVIAGEVSGDMHAGALVASLRKRIPQLECFGVGGDALAAAGAELAYHVRDTAAVGLTEVIPKLLFFRRMFRHMVELARDRRPDVVLLVDYPGFNLRFAGRAHAMGIKVVYYVCPQVWAWHKSRVSQMAQVIDRLMVIFPFEPAVFAGTQLKVDYVGHPLVDEARAALSAPERELPWNGDTRIALLPGSRTQEVRLILPSFVAAAGILARAHPNAGFIIASPSEQIADVARSTLAALGPDRPHCSIVVGQTREVLRQARAAFVASGTATLETALMGCPMVIAYKISRVSYLLLRWLVKVDNIGMVNIVAGRRICPEFVQDAAQPAVLADAIEPLIQDSDARRQAIEDLHAVAAALGTGGAHELAADILAHELAR